GPQRQPDDGQDSESHPLSDGGFGRMFPGAGYNKGSMFPTLAAAGCAGSGFLAWAVRGRSASVFGRSVWRGDPNRRAIALTFDDGPSEATPEILAILDRHHAPATFFQCGANVDRLPEIARAVHDAGHEIGNHSYSHPLLCFRSRRFMEDDFRR